MNATDLFGQLDYIIHILVSGMILHYRAVQLGFLSLESGGLLSCGGDIVAGMYEH